MNRDFYLPCPKCGGSGIHPGPSHYTCQACSQLGVVPALLPDEDTLATLLRESAQTITNLTVKLESAIRLIKPLAEEVGMDTEQVVARLVAIEQVVKSDLLDQIQGVMNAERN